MTTTYQFEDGKIILVTDPPSGNVKLINVVHVDRDVANKVADKFINYLRNNGD